MASTPPTPPTDSALSDSALSDSALVVEAKGIRSDVTRLRFWVVLLVGVTAVGAMLAAVMLVAVLAVLDVATDTKAITANTNVAANEAKRTADRLEDCTTPSERDRDGKVVVAHPCYEGLRMPNVNPNVAPIMTNVDCLIRRALDGEPPPAEINNCPAG